MPQHIPRPVPHLSRQRNIHRIPPPGVMGLPAPAVSLQHPDPGTTLRPHGRQPENAQPLPQPFLQHGLAVPLKNAIFRLRRGLIHFPPGPRQIPVKHVRRRHIQQPRPTPRQPFRQRLMESHLLPKIPPNRGDHDLRCFPLQQLRQPSRLLHRQAVPALRRTVPRRGDDLIVLPQGGGHRPSHQSICA